MPRTESWIESIKRHMPRRVAEGIGVLEATAADGTDNELPLYAPAVAYSLIISLAPILLAAQIIGGGKLAQIVAPDSALASAELSAESALGRAIEWAGPWAWVFGIGLLFFGLSSLFSQLVGAITRIWHQAGGAEGLSDFVRTRLFGLLLVGVAGVALLVSAVGGVAIVWVIVALEQVAAGAGIELQWLEEIVANRIWFDMAFAWLLFVTAFTTVPRVRPRIRDVAFGSLLTAIAYALGQKGLALYMNSSSRFTALGAFGTFLGFLVWAYYTAAIVLWGAQLTYELQQRRVAARRAVERAAAEV